MGPVASSSPVSALRQLADPRCQDPSLAPPLVWYNTDMNRLVIIDGNAIIHRAYHALPPLTTKDGKVVNAVYGFVSMLLRVISDLKPTHLVVAFDRPEPTFRKTLFKDYQSQRPDVDEALGSQFSLVKDVVAAMKIPIFEKAGYEADDVIGTIANQVKSEKSKVKSQVESLKMNEVIIVTGDRDILQLVDDQIRVYMPVKGLSESKLYDRAAVREKFGVESSQVVDYKALVGDASDNYPGVAGIGPKTAAELLSRYKSLEGIYQHLDREKNEKLVAKLKSGEKDAEMAKKLATIVTDVPVEADLDLCQLHSLDTKEAEEVFIQLGFKSLLVRMRGGKKEKEENPSTVAQGKKKNEEDDNQLSFL